MSFLIHCHLLSVINALTKLSPYDSNAASKATLLHNSMIELYNKTKLLDYRPSTLSFSAVINCWAKSNSTNRVQKACEEYYNLETWFMLTGAPSLCVTTVAQNAVLDAMARSSTSRNDFAWQCQLKFREITRPDQRSYGTVIFAYANTKSFEGTFSRYLCGGRRTFSHSCEIHTICRCAKCNKCFKDDD